MKHVRGFTIVELMVALMLLAIITATAAPGFSRLLTRISIDGNTSRIQSAISFARSESVQSQNTVTICSSNDNATCTGESDWAIGWIVFIDADNDTQVTAGDSIIRVWEEGADRGATLIEASSRASLTFDDEGRVDSNSQTISLELVTPNCGVDQLRTITVGAVGRATVAAGHCI